MKKIAHGLVMAAPLLKNKIQAQQLEYNPYELRGQLLILKELQSLIH